MCGDMVASWLWTDWGTACPEWTQDSSTSARWIGAQRGVPPLTQFSSQSLVARPQWYWGEDLEGAQCQVSSPATSPLRAPPSRCFIFPCFLLSLFFLFSYHRSLSLSLSVCSLSHCVPLPPSSWTHHHLCHLLHFMCTPSPPGHPGCPLPQWVPPPTHTPCRYCKHFLHHLVCSCI